MTERGSLRGIPREPHRPLFLPKLFEPTRAERPVARECGVCRYRTRCVKNRETGIFRGEGDETNNKK